MSTISVPLPKDLLAQLEDLVKRGVIPNKAEGARQALKKYIEELEVQEILQASKEPRLSGDLDDLAKKLK
jgi:metal-responsive CopG/Arc/MetJ family transcriptional regulator